MDNVLSTTGAASMQQMHELYLEGGRQRGMAPHIIYQDGKCPHDGCQQSLRAIDFRLEAFGRVVHDPLVRAWWADTGFAGRCPTCGGWIHFTIHGKRAIGDQDAEALPKLPANWADEAIIL